MKIKVDPKNYTSWDYIHYMNKSGDEIPKPKDAIYEVGDVIVTNEDGEGKLRLGVVLGCIVTDKGHEELRTDVCGMITFDRIRHANFSDFHKSWIPNFDKLNKECHGYKIVVDREKFTFRATEPKETLLSPKNKIVDGYTISENSPKFGDKMICVQKNNFNYKKIMTPTKQQIDLGIIDTKNWKVIVE